MKVEICDAKKDKINCSYCINDNDFIIRFKSKKIVGININTYICFDCLSKVFIELLKINQQTLKYRNL